MKNVILRRIACAGAMLGLGIASSPRLQAANVAPIAVAAASANHAMPAQAASTPVNANVTGEGWGAMIGCAACVVAAGMTLAGGPVAIAIAVTAPGSAIALLACAAVCYDAFQ